MIICSHILSNSIMPVNVCSYVIMYGYKNVNTIRQQIFKYDHIVLDSSYLSIYVIISDHILIFIVENKRCNYSHICINIFICNYP